MLLPLLFVTIERNDVDVSNEPVAKDLQGTVEALDVRALDDGDLIVDDLQGRLALGGEIPLAIGIEQMADGKRVLLRRRRFGFGWLNVPRVGTSN